MKTFTFTEKERDIIANALLSLIDNNSEAVKLVKSKRAIDAIKKEQEETLDLLNRLCKE